MAQEIDLCNFIWLTNYENGFKKVSKISNYENGFKEV